MKTASNPMYEKNESNAVVFTPSDLAGSINQTFDAVYGRFLLVGELANFRICRNKWLYFDLKDDTAKIACFGTVYQLPGPLEDGLLLEVSGEARLHPQFGFSVSVSGLRPTGEGTIKKASNLLAQKLEKEGLFDDSRKRLLPEIPQRIGLITARDSAAFADFIKIIDHRFGGLTIEVAHTAVQGIGAPTELVNAVGYFNGMPNPPEVLVITRGGGSADDLAAFNDERVVRAVAASRIPTVVAIGHESDISLAELAADVRASTPTNAAAVVVPDRRGLLDQLARAEQAAHSAVLAALAESETELNSKLQHIDTSIGTVFRNFDETVASTSKLVSSYDPSLPLRRGYALVRSAGRVIRSSRAVAPGDDITASFADGTISATINEKP